MDKNTLSQLFNATLSQDQNVRMKVELTLKDVCKYFETIDNFQLVFGARTYNFQSLNITLAFSEIRGEDGDHSC